MSQVVSRFRGSGGRIGVAGLVALAIVTATSVDSTEAQLPSVSVPGVVTVQPTAPSLTVTAPSLPPVKVTPPALTVPSTPATPEVTVTLPSVQTPPVAIPKPPPVSLPQAPAVAAPKVAAPQAPQIDAPRAGAQAPAGSLTNRPAPSAGGSAPRAEGSPPGPGGSGPVGPDAAGSPTAASLASVGIPSAAALRAASPAQRRQLLRRAWNRPLRGKSLRRLRRALEQYQGCLGALPPQGRRTLRLRAGIGPGQPASRRVVARRLGIPLTRALRVERSALRQLVSAGERGRCGGGGAMTPAGTAGGGSATGPASGPRAGARGGADARRDAPRGDGSRDARDRRGNSGPDYLLDPSRSGESAVGTVLVLLLVLLALALGVLALARLFGGRSRAQAGGAPVAQPERPLLFLSAAALISTRPNATAPPATRSQKSAPTSIPAVYRSYRARALVQRLAQSFTLVLIAGWEHDDNRVRRVALDDRELPVLTARQGSADSKIRGVARVARSRPAAWVDPDVDDRHKRWAGGRSLPTLLIAADDDALMEEQVFTLLREWAERLAHGDRPADRVATPQL